jgi:hypothetical protein
MILLNKACIRFEPNDPDFIRVTHRVYEYVNEIKDFDYLYSTRFFGPMVFYLAWYKKLDNITSHLLDKSNLKDCLNIIQLYHILHESTDSNTNSIDFIKVLSKYFNFLPKCYSYVSFLFRKLPKTKRSHQMKKLKR